MSDGNEKPRPPRRNRRVKRPGASAADPTPQRGLDTERALDDRDEGWNERGDSNDDRLRLDKPPHWG